MAAKLCIYWPEALGWPLLGAEMKRKPCNPTSLLHSNSTICIMHKGCQVSFWLPFRRLPVSVSRVDGLGCENTIGPCTTESKARKRRQKRLHSSDTTTNRSPRAVPDDRDAPRHRFSQADPCHGSKSCQPIHALMLSLRLVVAAANPCLFCALRDGTGKRTRKDKKRWCTGNR